MGIWGSYGTTGITLNSREANGKDNGTPHGNRMSLQRGLIRGIYIRFPIGLRDHEGSNGKENGA